MPKIRTAIPVANSGDKASDADTHLEQLAALAPERNGSTRKQIAAADYLTESIERQREAGHCLVQWLVKSRDSDLEGRWDGLTVGQRECIGLATSLTAMEARMERRIRDYRRAAEEERKRNRKLVPYPSVSRRAFDNTDAAPRGVEWEGR